MRRQTSVPSRSGSPRSSTTRSGGRSANSLERVGAGAGDFDVVAARAQQRSDRPLDRDLVVDEQDAGVGHRIVRRAGPGSLAMRRHPERELSAAVRRSSRPRCGRCSTASSPRAIHRPMPVPEARDPGRRAAIEALEQMRQIRGGDARAVIAHLTQSPRHGPRPNLDRRPAGAVLRGVLEDMGQRAAVSRGSSRTGSSGSRSARRPGA